jgi:hypothetical protein
MRLTWLSLVALLLAVNAKAESIGAPHLVPDDSWTYQNTIEDKTGWHQNRMESTIVRVGATTMAVTAKQVGSTMPPTEQLVGADWSRVRSVNGHETTINRPLVFLLNPGKSWTVEYSEDHPSREHSSEHFVTSYKVSGWEDVTVPAGTYHAIKIEADGSWTATLAPAVSAVTGSRLDAQGSTVVMQTGRTLPTTAAGRIYKAFWYDPAAKRWVKSLEEYYNSNGIRSSRYTSELISFQAAN